MNVMPIKEKKPRLTKKVLDGFGVIQRFFERNFSYYSFQWDTMNIHETDQAKRALQWAQHMRGYRARAKDKA